MIVAGSGAVIEQEVRREHSQQVEHDGLSLRWSGLIYTPGLRAGEDTVRFVAEELRRTGMVPFEKLRGAFSPDSPMVVPETSR